MAYIFEEDSALLCGVEMHPFSDEPCEIHLFLVEEGGRKVRYADGKPFIAHPESQL